MKFHLHLFSFLLASIAAVVYGYWPRVPVWSIQDQRILQFSGINPSRLEWHMLAGDRERKQWHLETRKVPGKEIIRTVQLHVPPVKGQVQYLQFDRSQSESDLSILVDHWTESTPNGGMKLEERLWLINIANGKVLREQPFITYLVGSVAQHQDRVAIAEKDCVWLVDGKTGVERSVKLKYPSNLAFSPDGQMLVCTSQDQLYIIDWAQAQALLPATFHQRVYSLVFLSPDLLVISSLASGGQEISRWHWDGSDMQRLSNGIVIKCNSWPLKVKEDANHYLHVSAFSGTDWPVKLRSIFLWLLSHNIPVDQWYPPEARTHWHVLDSNDRHIDEYNLPQQAQRLPVSGSYAVELKEVDKSNITNIMLWDISPAWPNALALGILVYLAFYLVVAMRRRKDVSNPVVDSFVS